MQPTRPSPSELLPSSRPQHPKSPPPPPQTASPLDPSSTAADGARPRLPRRHLCQATDSLVRQCPRPHPRPWLRLGTRQWLSAGKMRPWRQVKEEGQCRLREQRRKQKHGSPAQRHFVASVLRAFPMDTSLGRVPMDTSRWTRPWNQWTRPTEHVPWTRPAGHVAWQSRTGHLPRGPNSPLPPPTPQPLDPGLCPQLYCTGPPSLRSMQPRRAPRGVRRCSICPPPSPYLKSSASQERLSHPRCPPPLPSRPSAVGPVLFCPKGVSLLPLPYHRHRQASRRRR